MVGVPLISEHTIDRIRSTVDLLDLVGRYAPDLRRAGASYKARCPLPDHDERTPSFNLRPERGVWHCFGCGRNGDVFKFIEWVEFGDGSGAQFRDAAEYVAGLLAIPIDTAGDAHSDERSRRKSAMRSATQKVVELYARHLNDPEAGAARKYLAERGFGADEAAKFGLGWAPTRTAAITEATLTDAEKAAAIDSGLARKSTRGPGIYDPFAGRLIWPLHDRQGRIVGVAGRTLRSESDTTSQGRPYRKYVNSDASDLYHKSSVLYGWHWARATAMRTQTLHVVEGYTDVMAMHAIGCENTVALCGTALSDEHAAMISNVVGSGHGRIVVMTDNDAAGRDAARTIFLACQDFADIHVVQWPAAKDDPCSVRAEHGDDALRELALNAKPWLQFTIEQTSAQTPDTPEGRSAAARAIRELLGNVRDKVLRTDYATAAEQQLKLPAGSITEGLPKPDRRPADPPQPAAPPEQHPPEQRRSITPAERRLIAAALNNAPDFHYLAANPPPWTPAAQHVWDACLAAAHTTDIANQDFIARAVSNLDPALRSTVTSMVFTPASNDMALMLVNQRIEAAEQRTAELTTALRALNPDDEQRYRELSGQRAKAHAQWRQARAEWRAITNDTA